MSKIKKGNYYYAGNTVITITKSLGSLQLEGRLVGRQSYMDSATTWNAYAAWCFGRCLLDIFWRCFKVLRLHRHLQDESWMEWSEIARYSSSIVVSQTFVVCPSDSIRTYWNGIYAVSRRTKVRRLNYFTGECIIKYTNKYIILQKLGKIATFSTGLMRGSFSHEISGRSGSR